MTLFLSYAQEDEVAAAEIAKCLRDNGLEVYDWQDVDRRGGPFPQQLEDAIITAMAFVALVSPDYVTSGWCRRERMLAIHMESYQQAVDSTRQFVHVVKVRATDHLSSGFLSGYDWHDATTPEARKKGPPSLIRRLRPTGNATAVGPTTATNSAIPSFRNRDEELRRITDGLNNPSGDHFWLVTAPPALGKSWLLDRLSTEMIQSRSRRADGPGATWGGRLLDIGEQSLDVRGDVSLLLTRMFGLNEPVPANDELPREVARRIIATGRPYLCLLDSADLLDKRTARELRAKLSRIYTLLQQAGNIDVRLGVVVASRRDDEWRGILPEPRVANLSLTEFKVNVVRAALDDLARQMRRNFSTLSMFDQAGHILRMSEGLPALLTLYLQWIEEEQWVEPERLESPEVFEKLARPYVRKQLLSVASLFPHGGEELCRYQTALVEALRSLVPYRLLTTSHLRHQLSVDDELRRAVGDIGWDPERLWDAMSRTALLRRLLDEPWHEVSAPIRRLLFRSYHPSADQRAAAHRAALAFVEVWVEKQAGTDQVRGVAECLFHEAAALGLEDPTVMAEALTGSVRKHCNALRPAGYAERDLRAALADRINHDQELTEALSPVPDLLDRLVGIITPGSGELA